MHPGPIYFKTPRKCQLFGIHVEGLSRQVNYLIDESVSCGKGANAVISLLHHFLTNFAIGEKHLSLHADNCGGQNKNAMMMWYLMWRVHSGLNEEASISFMLAGHTKFAPDWCFGLLKKKLRHTSSLEDIEEVMWYLMWRVHSGLNEEASISFMLAGHTKFAPDWCFGLLKKKLRHTYVSSLEDIEEVCKQSSVTGVNTSQLVGHEDGSVVVPMYDWSNHLQNHFVKVAGIKTMHHLSVL